jgi:hypothetical protein
VSAIPPNPYESPQTVSTLSPEPPRPIWDEVEVEYDLTIEDYVAFNVHHLMRSPAQRKARARTFLVLLVISELINGLLLLLQTFRGPLKPEALFFHAVVGVVLLVVLGSSAFTAWRKGTSAWGLKRLLRNMFAQGDPALLIGKRRVRVTKNYLEEISDLRETRLKLQCVQRIDVTPVYAFVYVAPVIAYLLPVRAFATPDHFARFVANLEGHTGKIAERFKT